MPDDPSFFLFPIFFQKLFPLSPLLIVFTASWIAFLVGIQTIFLRYLSSRLTDLYRITNVLPRTVGPPPWI